MAGLSNIFGGGASDDNTENASHTDFLQSAENTLGVEYSDNNAHSSQSADGSSSSDASGHDFSLNSDSSSLLSSVTDDLGITHHDAAN